MKIGEKAPGFTLTDAYGNEVSLSDYLGQKVVLYFYSRDNTSGCTKQALGFAKIYEEYLKRKIVVIGISKDSVTSHKNFASKYQLPFILLSDPELSVIRSYDVWKEKNMYGKKVFGVVRTAFLIDEQGQIEQIFSKVKPDTNAVDVLSFLDGK